MDASLFYGTPLDKKWKLYFVVVTSKSSYVKYSTVQYFDVSLSSGDESHLRCTYAVLITHCATGEHLQRWIKSMRVFPCFSQRCFSTCRTIASLFMYAFFSWCVCIPISILMAIIVRARFGKTFPIGENRVEHHFLNMEKYNNKGAIDMNNVDAGNRSQNLSKITCVPPSLFYQIVWSTPHSRACQYASTSLQMLSRNYSIIGAHKVGTIPRHKAVSAIEILHMSILRKHFLFFIVGPQNHIGQIDSKILLHYHCCCSVWHHTEN